MNGILFEIISPIYVYNVLFCKLEFELKEFLVPRSREIEALVTGKF